MTWIRPNNVPYPKVYVEFEGKPAADGLKRKYWIQDLTEEYYEFAVEAYIRGFLTEEPISKCSKILDDPVAVDDYRKIWMRIFKQRMSLICLADDGDGKPQMAGFNSLAVISKDDEEGKVNSPKSQKIMGILQYLQKDKDPFKMLNVDKYMYAMGLSVLREFRGEGLGQHLLSAREPLCTQFGVKATVTVFSSFISQKQAARNGFSEISAVAYDEMPEHLQIPGVSEHSKYCKLMYKLF